MSEATISLNQIAEFSTSTEKGKQGIIRRQLNPDVFRVPRYQMTKARVKKSIELKGDLNPVYDGLQKLRQRVPKTDWQITDRRTSIDAMERFVLMSLPSVLKDIDYTIIKTKKRGTIISDVEIIVAPEVIVQGIINGEKVLGAVKIHIAKSKPFDYHKSKIVASLIRSYLTNEIAGDDVVVKPELCFSLDIFGGRFVCADKNDLQLMEEITKICNEIKTMWDAA